MRPADPSEAPRSPLAPSEDEDRRLPARIEALRKKFVGFTMLAVICVLVLVGLAVNVANSLATTADLDNLLTLISKNEGASSSVAQSAPGYLDDYDELDDWDEWDDDADERGPLGFLERPLTRETSYATRWFSVRWVPGGSIAEINLSHIASVSQADLPRFVEVATQAGPGFGWVGDFRYLVIEGAAQDEAIFLDASDEAHALRTLALLTVAVVVVSAAAIFVAVWALSGWVVRPFAEADRRQRRFVTDASHELKTPLAVILTSLGVLEMDVGENRFLEKAESQAHRMGELVDELVTLSRLDEEADRPSTTFDASAAVASVAEGFEDHARSRGHGLTLAIARELVYTGDEPGLRQIVSVLLDNAVKYALPEGAITLTLERHRRRGLRLTCANPAAPMAAETLAHLFDRFYRPDDSRSRESGGFGIGLSIARQIAEAAGGGIAATQDAEGTLTFEVLLP